MTQAHATSTKAKKPPQGTSPLPETASPASPAVSPDPDDLNAEAVDNLFKELKTLLSTVEKLQKARHEVGDVKPLIVRLLDGELLSGEELETLKSGVSGLSKLVKLYGDYQTALEKAQPARTLLDQVLQ